MTLIAQKRELLYSAIADYSHAMRELHSDPLDATKVATANFTFELVKARTENLTMEEPSTNSWREAYYQMEAKFLDANQRLGDRLAELLDLKDLMLNAGIEHNEFSVMLKELIAQQRQHTTPLDVEDIELLETKLLVQRRRDRRAGKPGHYPDPEFYDGFVAAEKHYGIRE